MSAPAMCKCGHDRDYFHGGGNGCTRTDCPCACYQTTSREPSDLTALIDAVAS